jgi:hypothetical protein
VEIWRFDSILRPWSTELNSLFLCTWIVKFPFNYELVSYYCYKHEKEKKYKIMCFLLNLLSSFPSWIHYSVFIITSLTCLPHSSRTLSNRICVLALNSYLKSAINNSQWNISYIYLWLYSLCGPWPLFQFLNPYTVGTTPWTEDQPVARPLPTHRTAKTQNKCTQTFMPRVGF